MIGMATAARFLKGTWKIWVPALILLLVAGTIWAQHSRIQTLKNQRDVAMVEHDRAMEEQKQLIKDIDRLNTILLQRQQAIDQLEIGVSNAKNRIRQLAENRPDVADWRQSALPAGLWEAADPGASREDPTGPDDPGERSRDDPDHQR